MAGYCRLDDRVFLTKDHPVPTSTKQNEGMSTWRLKANTWKLIVAIIAIALFVVTIAFTVLNAQVKESQSQLGSQLKNEAIHSKLNRDMVMQMIEKFNNYTSSQQEELTRMKNSIMRNVNLMYTNLYNKQTLQETLRTKTEKKVENYLKSLNSSDMTIADRSEIFIKELEDLNNLTNIINEKKTEISNLKQEVLQKFQLLTKINQKMTNLEKLTEEKNTSHLETKISSLGQSVRAIENTLDMLNATTEKLISARRPGGIKRLRNTVKTIQGMLASLPNLEGKMNNQSKKNFALQSQMDSYEQKLKNFTKNYEQKLKETFRILQAEGLCQYPWILQNLANFFNSTNLEFESRPKQKVSCYYVSQPFEAYSFNDSRQYCWSYHADLVAILDEHDNNFLKNRLKTDSNDSFWIGLEYRKPFSTRDDDMAYEWEWIQHILTIKEINGKWLKQPHFWAPSNITRYEDEAFVNWKSKSSVETSLKTEKCARLEANADRKWIADKKCNEKHRFICEHSFFV